MVPEGRFHELPLGLPQQAGINEDARQLITDRLVQQRGGHGRIDTPGEAADHAVAADLVTGPHECGLQVV